MFRTIAIIGLVVISAQTVFATPAKPPAVKVICVLGFDSYTPVASQTLTQAQQSALKGAKCGNKVASITTNSGRFAYLQSYVTRDNMGRNIRVNTPIFVQY
jgi:hypothetical protein